MLFGKKSEKKNKECRFDYSKEKDTLAYRYDKWKSYVDDFDTICSIDTNLMMEIDNSKEILKNLQQEFKQRDIPFIHYKVASQKKNLFGIPIGGKGHMDHRLIFALKPHMMDENLFFQYLSYFDLVVGIMPQKDVEELWDELEMSYSVTFAESEDFAGYYYDSMNFNIIRTNNNVVK